jgi:hypothetical protein
VTLTLNSATTVVTTATGLCAPGSVPILIPATANAATEFGAGTWYISSVGARHVHDYARQLGHGDPDILLCHPRLTYCVDPKGRSSDLAAGKRPDPRRDRANGLSEFADIEKDVLSGDQLLWLAISDHIEAAATTHLIKTSGKPVCVIYGLLGSQRERWLPLSPKIENYAKAKAPSA